MGSRPRGGRDRALGTLLAVPLRVPPEDVPLPLVDGRALAATLAHDRALSAAVVPRLLQEQANPGEVAALFDFVRSAKNCVRMGAPKLRVTLTNSCARVAPS